MADNMPWPDLDELVDPFEIDVWTVKAEEAQLLIRKHHDYGPTNISRSPGGPLNGLAVRLWDKVARLFNLGVLIPWQTGGDASPQNEPLRDTGMDIANYGTIVTLNVDGRWPS